MTDDLPQHKGGVPIYGCPHAGLSATLWLASLWLPTFYIGPYAEYSVGWDGLFAGPIVAVAYIPWFAHPFYLTGLVKARNLSTSTVLGLLAVAAVLSLSFYTRVNTLLAPPAPPIVGYGWGYFCWLASAAIFAIGQLHAWASGSGRSAWFRNAVLVQYAWIGVGLVLFLRQLYGSGGPLEIIDARNNAFEQVCAPATQQIHRQIAIPISVYDASGPGGVFGSLIEANRSGEWYEVSQVYWGQRGLLERGIVTAFENNDGDSGFGRDNPRIGGELKSDFALLVVDYRSDPELGLRTAKIQLVDRRDGTLVASSAIAYNYIGHRFCGYAPSDRFSRFTFLADVLSP